MKKKLLSVLMAAVMVAGVGGVGAAQVKADDEKILGAGIYSASDNFNSYIGKAITNACDGIFKTNIEDGQNDQSTQNNQVDTMLAKGASAVAVSVCDVTAAPTLIQKCKDAGNVPIIFFNKEISAVDRPVKILKDFARVELMPGEEKKVSLQVSSKDMAYYSEEKDDFVEEDITYIAYTGDCSCKEALKSVKFEFGK